MFTAYGLKFDTDRLPPVLDPSVESGGGESWAKLKKHYKKVFNSQRAKEGNNAKSVLKDSYVYVLKRDIEISEATNMGILNGSAGNKRNWEHIVRDIVFTHSSTNLARRNAAAGYIWTNDYEAISNNYGVHRDKLAIILSAADIHPYVEIQHGEVVFFVDYGNAGAPNLDPNSSGKQSMNWLFEDGFFGVFGKMGGALGRGIGAAYKGAKWVAGKVGEGVAEAVAIGARAVGVAVEVAAKAAVAVKDVIYKAPAAIADALYKAPGQIQAGAAAVLEAGKKMAGRIANGIFGGGQRSAQAPTPVKAPVPDSGPKKEATNWFKGFGIAAVKRALLR